MGVPDAGRISRATCSSSVACSTASRTIGRPVFSDVGLRAGPRHARSGRSHPKASSIPAPAGRWHRPWDPQLQAEWIDAVYKLALSKPYVEIIAWGNLADINPNAPRRRAARRHAQAQARLREAPGAARDASAEEAVTPRAARIAPLDCAAAWRDRRARWRCWSFTSPSGCFAIRSTYPIRSRATLPGPSSSPIASIRTPPTWQTMAALPMIGEKRARLIVEYREQFQALHPGQRAFNSAQDLLRIRGIGPAMMSQLQPYLLFPGPSATTRP